MQSVGAIVGFFDFVVANVVTLAPWIRRWHVILAVALFEAPLSLLRSTAHPAFRLVMIFGNVAVAVAAGAVIYFGLSTTGIQPLSQLTAVNSDGLGLTFGVCIFMFSAHMEIVSIEQEMRERERVYDVISYTFAAITALHVIFGFLAYASFGEATGRCGAEEPPSCPAAGRARPRYAWLPRPRLRP